MSRGGARNGAGRKPGSATEKTREIADEIAKGEMTPLEVMIFAMREHQKAKRYDQAAAIAKDAAPYIHPRLSAVHIDGQIDFSTLSDADLAKRLAGVEAQIALGAVTPPGLEAQPRAADVGDQSSS